MSRSTKERAPERSSKDERRKALREATKIYRARAAKTYAPGQDPASRMVRAFHKMGREQNEEE